MTNMQDTDYQIEMHLLSGADPRGVLFVRDGQLLRGITGIAAAEIIELFERGIIAELVQHRLIPRTWISTAEIPGYPLVLEHERISNLTYPHEWTFTMFCEAAKCILNVREIVNRYGFDLSDAHSSNVTFDGVIPLWLDLGSIVKSDNTQFWHAEHRFKQSFIFPLRIWSRYGDYIGRRILLSNDYLPDEVSLISIRPWIRYLGARIINKLVRAKDIYFSLTGISFNQFKEKLQRMPRLVDTLDKFPTLERVLHRIAASRKMPFRRTSIECLRKSLSRLRRPGFLSRWETYHCGVLSDQGSFEHYSRFLRVVEILRKLNPLTIIEIGANQGGLSKLIVEELHPKRMIALDVDEGALDLYYRANRRDNKYVHHAVLDVIKPALLIPQERPEIRLHSEAVVALAVTHHMVIGQCNSVEYTLRRLASFGSKWLLVEYMPYGCYPNPVPFPPPDTYSAERFKSAFLKVADLIEVQELEPTRILYVGKIKAAANNSSAK